MQKCNQDATLLLIFWETWLGSVFEMRIQIQKDPKIKFSGPWESASKSYF